MVPSMSSRNRPLVDRIDLTRSSQDGRNISARGYNLLYLTIPPGKSGRHQTHGVDAPVQARQAHDRLAS